MALRNLSRPAALTLSAMPSRNEPYHVAARLGFANKALGAELCFS
jgi:hypothetical protein